VSAAQTIFALLPHMHQLGTHFSSTLTLGDGERRVLYDAPFDFGEQTFRGFEPIPLWPGDQITTRCTWWNSRDRTVRWGPSTDAEMCFSVFYRYRQDSDSVTDFCVD
jgi:hypothetical protein